MIEFLADHLIAQSHPADKILYITCKDRTLCNKPECLPLCDHEEADTRMLLHVKHALSQGFQFICIQSLDTDAGHPFGGF